MSRPTRSQRGVAALALEVVLAAALIGSAAWGAYRLNRTLPGASDLIADVIPPGAVVVDARGSLSYRAGHVPGALQLWSRDLLSFEGPVVGTLAPPDVLAQDIAALGLVPGASTIVYDDGDATNGPLVVLTLRAFGIDARMLRGGLERWVADGGAPTRELPAAAAPTDAHALAEAFDRRLVIDPREAVEHLAQNRIAPVDVRGRDAYLAEHIENAVHVPGDLLLPDGRLPRWSELHQLAQRARLTGDTHPLIYGADANQAAAGWLALHAYGIRHLHVHAGPYPALVEAGLPVSEVVVDRAVSEPSATVCWQ